MNNTTETKPGSPQYWRSLDQWRNDDDFRKLAETEFMTSPLRESDGQEGGWARREFLKLMGASLALTTFGCVRKPAQKIVPYVNRPKDLIEGIANHYASTWSDGSEVFGVVVATREGRPINVTGNTNHAINRGGMSARAYAHVLNLYDPARLTKPAKNLLNEKKTNSDTVSVTYAAADKEIAAQLKKGGVGILTGSIISPSLKQVMGEFASAFNAKTYVWEPLSEENFVKGQEMAYGQAVAPRLVLENAKYILSVQNDFLGTFLNSTEQSKGFAARRTPGPDMNKLVVLESLMSLTGTNADVRHRIRPSAGLHVLMGLLHEILVNKKATSYAGDGSVTNIVKQYADAEEMAGLEKGTLAKIADELLANRGQSLVLGGDDVAMQVAANLLNSALGNDGATIDSRRSPNMGFQGSSQNLARLIADLTNGSIKTLIIHGVNPGYSAPKNAALALAVRKAEMIVYTGDRMDETAVFSNFVLPDHHPMEGWGDAEGQKGVYSVQQPTIEPLYETRGFGDTLIAFAKAAGVGGPSRHESFYHVVKATVTSRMGSDWTEALQSGAVDKSGSRTAKDSARSFRSSSLSVCARKDEPKTDFELIIYPTVALKDGTLANTPWLQEFPDPVTKIVWDNYFTVSPDVARERKIKQGQNITVKIGDRELTAPAHIQPGQADSAIGLAMGYGRTRAGEIANGVGVNAFDLASFSNGATKYHALPVTIEVLNTVTPLACTQGHHAMSGKTPEGIDMGSRQIVVEATLEQWKKSASANIHRHKIFSAWSGHKYDGHKWGMSIDLNVCNGCSACVIACQSENNISTVGKKYVLQGREMHWIRVDRYYVGEPNNPDTVHMPVTCQHCDNAPCETVCPVAATVHSNEGTNDMIYNRCVGTRYCSNNCPYKVRRFNWFNYAAMEPNLHAKPMNMQLNPEVTVRPRGVMEKCTFCTHRIQQAKTKAKLEDRKVRDGDVVVACQAGCPTNAITFGDMNDPESKISKILKDERHYALLEELNTRPALQYASKIRNTDKLKGPSAHAEGGHGENHGGGDGHGHSEGGHH